MSQQDQAERIAELKKLAEASSPGPWEDGCHTVYSTTGDADMICKQMSTEDSAFIAAANPQTILALLDRINNLEQGLRKASYALFEVKRMVDVPPHVVEHVASACDTANAVIDAE